MDDGGMNCNSSLGDFCDCHAEILRAVWAAQDGRTEEAKRTLYRIQGFIDARTTEPRLQRLTPMIQDCLRSLEAETSGATRRVIDYFRSMDDLTAQLEPAISRIVLRAFVLVALIAALWAGLVGLGSVHWR
jgi:hypothetical protein